MLQVSAEAPLASAGEAETVQTEARLLCRFPPCANLRQSEVSHHHRLGSSHLDLCALRELEVTLAMLSCVFLRTCVLCMMASKKP